MTSLDYAQVADFHGA